MTEAIDRDELIETAARFAALPAFPLAVREYTVSLTRFRRYRLSENEFVSKSSPK
jgi:hypothetical protein